MVKGKWKGYTEIFYKKDYRMTETFVERKYIQELTPLVSKMWQAINQLSTSKAQGEMKYLLNCLNYRRKDS